MNKDNKYNNKDNVEVIEAIIIDNDNNSNNHNSIPIARLSPNGLVDPPAPLNFIEYSEFFEEWLPEPTPGQKRKLRHRRDNPSTPPSLRRLPRIIPRKTLPPRNINIPLTRGSVHGSPFLNDREYRKKRTTFF